MSGFNLRPTEDTMVFIDGPNLYGAAKIVGCDIDYRSLQDYFTKNSFTNRIFYYSSILDTGEQGLGPWFSVLETDVLATELPILFCAF